MLNTEWGLNWWWRVEIWTGVVKFEPEGESERVICAKKRDVISRNRCVTNPEAGGNLN